MRCARAAAVITWMYTATYGVPAIPVSIYLLRRGILPAFGDVFEMYGGPWWRQTSDTVFIALMLAFLVVTVVAAWLAWLLWRGSRTGAVLHLVVLPVEALLWIGFALPIPWLLGLLRAGLVIAAWRSLCRRRDTAMSV